MANKSSRRLSDEERAERRRHDRERLQRTAQDLLSSEGWARWVKTRAMFHAYSAGNCMLLAAQAHALGIALTHVAGFRTWRKLGRAVRKGEAGLRILATRHRQGPRPADRRADRPAADVVQDRVRVRRLADERSPWRGARGAGAATGAVDRRLARAPARPAASLRGVARVLGFVRGDRRVGGWLVRSEGQADRHRRRRAGQRSAARTDPRVRTRVGDRL